MDIERLAVELQIVVSAVSVLALVPAAFVFIVNQREEALRRREAIYIEANNQFQDFLKLTLEYPALGAALYYEPVDEGALTTQQLAQRDTLFEILTSIMERAFLVYRQDTRSFRRAQWAGWVSYIDNYCSRQDYREWWLRIMGDGDWSVAFRQGASQYDTGFERFLIGRLKAHAPEPAAGS